MHEFLQDDLGGTDEPALMRRQAAYLTLTIAGYNAGEAAVVRYAGIPPFEETQGYVTRVLTYYRRYRTMGDPTLASRAY